MSISESAPGERSATRMSLGARQNPATLLDAAFSSGNLVLASEKFLQLHRPPWNAVEISLVRGDPRGSHARRVGSAVLAPFAATSPFQWQPPDDATFVPGGLVFFAKYYNFQKDTQTRFLAGFLPLAG